MYNITITDAAKAHFIRMMKQANKVCLTLKLGRSGCNGYSFDYEYKMGPHSSLLYPLNTEPDTGYEYEFFIDGDAAPKMMGATIDYVTEGFTSKLTYDLPLAAGECGCGKSINF